MFPQIPLLIFFTFSIILSATLLFLRTKKQSKDDPTNPPGPPTFPIIGNLHMLGTLPHRTLQALSKIYGPIMSLRLGQVQTIIVSSSEAAELFLKAHDVVFASRPKLEAINYLSYGSKGLLFSEYGPYWRHVRKVCTLQLLSVSKVKSFEGLRKKESMRMVKEVAKVGGGVVNVSEVVENVLEEIMYQMVFGYPKDDEFDLKGLIQEAMRLSGAFNLSDYVPWLAPFDLQGLRRNFKKISKVADNMLEKIIKQHEQGSNTENDRHNKDFIDILLSLMHQPIDPHNEENHVIDRNNIKAIILDMIAGSFETSSTVAEWALSELIRNPRVMKNLQDELASVVGMNKLVEESDLAKLSYLDIVIKETLRLYPVGALILRESTEDATVHGYYIKKNTRIMVNLWAIGRDSKVWSHNAEVFYPERFIDTNIDFRGGYNFPLIPFGSGRRACPGMHLGLISVKLVVAQLVHCFSWELPCNMTPDDIDMSEKFGLAVPRAKHLFAVPTFRLHSEPYNESN